MTPLKSITLACVVILIIAIPFAPLSCGKASEASLAPVAAGTVEWLQLNVSGPSQAESNLIRMPTGENFLIDAGELNYNLIPKLQALGIKRLNKIFVSHPHKDHYSGINSLVGSSIVVDEIYFNYPDRALCDGEIPWGCDYVDITNTLTGVRDRQIPVKPLTAGDLVYQNGDIKLEVLYAFDAVSPPLSSTNVNDMSAVMALSNRSVRALFTGDLGPTSGAYLAGLSDPRLKAQLLKVPHHAAEAVAPKEFFEWVNPAAAFVPAPTVLWDGSRSARVRAWLESKSIPVYVSELFPQTRATLYSDRYAITTDDPRLTPP